MLRHSGLWRRDNIRRMVCGSDRMLTSIPYAAKSHATRRQCHADNRGSDLRRPLRDCLRRSSPFWWRLSFWTVPGTTRAWMQLQRHVELSQKWDM